MAHLTLAQRVEEADQALRIVTMLLHDERFSGWSLEQKLARFHFSKQYLEFCKSLGWEPYLYCFHESVRETQVYGINGLGVIKVFPIEFRFPLGLRFGNDHNPKSILKELVRDAPDIVHFHQYYLFSFPYIAQFIKRKLSIPLTTQLHSYHQKWKRRLLHLPCLIALKSVDRIFYSYKPEETVYRKLGLLEKTVQIPIPSINPKLFKPGEKRREANLLYVGRIPPSLNTYAEKSPAYFLLILRELLHYKNVNFTIVGDGAGLSYCKELASKLGIEKNVKFKGFLPRCMLPNYYQRSALTVIPLELEDIDGFFDGAIQESLACGTAVAAFKASSKKPLRGTLGFLLSKKVVKAAEEISQLLNEPEMLEDVGQKGSRFVHNNCSEEVLKKRLSSEWEGLLKK
jgi:glycosyltransferase involved in cell wall biosynthesis